VQYSRFYLTDTDPHPEGWGAAERDAGFWAMTCQAVDYNGDDRLGLGSRTIGIQLRVNAIDPQDPDVR
jgi:hypothetical protein